MRRGPRVVRGITGGFALDLLATLLRLQERWSIAGDLLEVGAFDGRVAVLLGINGADGERNWCIDTFDWPC